MACIEAWWVTAAFAAISCFGGTSPTGRNWSLLAGTRKNRQSMRTDVFFEATPSESFVEGTPSRQRAEIGDVVAQIERRLGCASDESSAYSPTPMFGLDPHGSHPRSVLRALVQVAGDNERRSEISPPIMGHETEGQRVVVQHFLHVVCHVFQWMACSLPPGPPNPVRDRCAEGRLITKVRDGVKLPLWLGHDGHEALLADRSAIRVRRPKLGDQVNRLLRPV